MDYKKDEQDFLEMFDRITQRIGFENAIIQLIDTMPHRLFERYVGLMIERTS